ncbi:MAG: hypothetical protein M1815_005955 [Lichina confinis]|nr:MAG: hypothetical protein M1815_005955 [Lichina confinis]
MDLNSRHRLSPASIPGPVVSKLSFVADILGIAGFLLAVYALVASRGSGGGHGVTYDLSSRINLGGTTVAVVGHSVEEIKELLNAVDDHGRRELERTGIFLARRRHTTRHATVAGNTFVPVSQGFQPSTFSSGPFEAAPIAGLTQVAELG